MLRVAIVIGLILVLSVPLFVFAQQLAPCNGCKAFGENVNCGNQTKCEDQRADTCLTVGGRYFVDKGNFRCKNGAADDHCGDKSYPCQQAAGVKCTCAWTCFWNQNTGCHVGQAVQEADPCNPGQMRQVCSYQKEKGTLSCDIGEHAPAANCDQL